MNYNKFKELLEKQATNYEELYKNLLSQFGQSFTENLYEKYMNDPEIDDEIKFERIAPYLEGQETTVKNNINFLETETTNYEPKTDDPVKLYLQSIGEVPLYTKEEELQLALEIKKLSRELLSRNITDESINAGLIKWGYKDNKESIQIDISSRKKQKKYLINLKEKMKDKNITKNIDELNRLIDDITIYIKYYEKKNDFCDHNLRLVVSIAKRYVGRGLTFLELIQEGNMGLMKAIDKFDSTKSYKFSTYATWWIRQATTRSIADQARIIRIPVHMVETINKYLRLMKKLESEYERTLTEEEKVKETGFSKEKIREIELIAMEPLSLETPIGEEEDSVIGDFIPDNEGYEDTTHNQILQNALKDKINEVLETTLTPREADVIKKRFGIGIDRQMTLEEIGKDHKVTRERIRQIESKALRKLRIRSKRDNLMEFLNK